MARTSQLLASLVVTFLTAFALLIASLLRPPTVALAADYTPACPGGVGDSAALVAAIIAANVSVNPDRIILEPGCTYAFANATDVAEGGSALPSITTPILIEGRGATLSRTGADPYRLLRVAPGADVTLRNLTLSNGLFSGFSFDGGAILNQGTLTLSGVTLTNSQAKYGGGIASFGTLTVQYSAILNNRSNDDGGGIAVLGGGKAIITNSTIAQNISASVPGVGGGMFVQGDATITNVTVAENQADEFGGLFILEGTIVATNSIIANNVSLTDGFGENCSPLSAGSSNNIEFPGTECGASALDADPLLGSFATSLYPLQTGSPAIDGGDSAFCGGRDQPGTRLVGASCDLGAVEFGDGGQNGAVIVVNSTADPGTGGCTSQECTLREAIETTNSTTDLQTIAFDIAGGGLQTIAVANGLPVISDGLLIDGWSQEGQNYSGPPLIEIDGAATNSTFGLNIQATDTTVRGLVINRFLNQAGNGFAIGVFSPVAADRNVWVYGNYLGVAFDGTSNRGNGQGAIWLGANANGNRIGTNADGQNDEAERNLLAGSAAFQGLLIQSDGNKVAGNYIGTDKSGTLAIPNGAGISIQGGSNNTIGGPNQAERNLIAFNIQAGVTVASGTGNQVVGNSLLGNGGLGIDLAASGVNGNDTGDGDNGANTLQNFPLLTGTSANASTTVVAGTLNSTPDQQYTINLYVNTNCDASGNGEGQIAIASGTVTTDGSGNATFSIPVGSLYLGGQQLSVTATNSAGDTSEFSPCLSVTANDSWQTAYVLNRPAGNGAFSSSASQYLLTQDQVAWFKLDVDPGSRLVITLSGMPVDYDLVLYDDIAALREQIKTVNDPLEHSIKVAPLDIGPLDIGPLDIGPLDIGPLDIGPLDIGPLDIGPLDIGPLDIGPLDIGPLDIGDGSSASAQNNSLRAIGARPGTATELIVRNTFANAGDVYLRVRGKNGVFSTAAPFTLTVNHSASVCAAVSPISGPVVLPGTPGNFETVIVTDLAGISTTATGGSAATAERTGLLTRLQDLASASKGAIIDLGAKTGPGPNDWKFPRVQAALAQAAAVPDCPYAMNLAASEIKALIDSYRPNNTLKYVVLVGNDSVVPFFRFPDNSAIDGGSQRDLKTALKANSRSQAGLKLNNVFNQDYYGSAPGSEIKRGGQTFLTPDLAVGRLVETAYEATQMLDAYLGTFSDNSPAPDGALRPSTALLSGYDFFEDTRAAIEQQFEAGISPANCGSNCYQADSLSAPPDWSADDLREVLFGTRHDLLFLGAHASPDAALAADYDLETILRSREVANQGNFVGSLLITIGCNFGFNIPDEDALGPGNDWTQDFHARGATVIASTGYQFGETEFIEYNERLYLELARELRRPGGAIPIGQALLLAKARYAAALPTLDGIHEKVLLASTLYGLPMFGIDMLSRAPIPTPAPELDAGDLSSADGLSYGDLTIDPNLNLVSENVPAPGGGTVAVSHLVGPSGVVQALPAEPVLPVDRRRIDVAGVTVRGVGFLGGSYSETSGQRARTGAIATEQGSFSLPFASSVLYPSRWWSTNFFEATYGGPTWLNLMPAQYLSDGDDSPTGKWRTFGSDLQLRVFYVNNSEGETPLAAPQILRVKGEAGPAAGSVTVSADVLGDTPADIAQVWVTYSEDCPANVACNGSWQSAFLNRVGTSERWEATFTPGVSDIVFMLQAVNRDGLVQVVSNGGSFYRLTVAESERAATQISLLNGPYTGGAWGDSQPVRARLTLADGVTAVPSATVTLAIGSGKIELLTDATGEVSGTVPLRDIPNPTLLSVIYGGDTSYGPSSAESLYTIDQRPTELAWSELTPLVVEQGQAGQAFALLSSVGAALPNRTVFFVGVGLSGTFVTLGQSDGAGTARLGILDWPAGEYDLTAYFGGIVPGYGEAREETYAAAQSLSRKLTVTPRPANGPVFISLPVTKGQYAAPYAYKAEATGWLTPTYSLVSGPSGMQIDSQSGLLIWTPGALGSYPVTIKATNETGSAEQSFTIVVGNNPFRPTPAPPKLACPAMLDQFGRADGIITAGGKPWHGPEGLGGYSIRNKQVQVFGGGPIHWKGPKYSATQKACLKLSVIDPTAQAQALILKVQGDTPNWRNGIISVIYLASEGQVRVDTFQKGNLGVKEFNYWRHYAPIKQSFKNGDVLGAVAHANGTVSIYKNGTLIGVVDTRGKSLAANGKATFSGNGNFFVNKGGYIGVWYIKAPKAKFDDFRAGNGQ
jgi:CSLREA domain-containing protein